MTAGEIGARGYDLDVKKPHDVAADHGDPEHLLANLEHTEAEIAKPRDQLRTILAEALLR